MQLKWTIEASADLGRLYDFLAVFNGYPYYVVDLGLQLSVLDQPRQC